VAAEISIVIICYEMARVIPRTLLSLSPDYQRDCPAGRCEIILIDNGSRSPPREDQFASLGLNLVYHKLPKTLDTPVEAVNFGLRQASAPLIGVWIDGARLASPGLVDSCARAAALHPRPVVATYNYHLGPAFQSVSMIRGYDASEEDRLLDSIGWPNDGSRLFEIAVPSWRSGVGGPMLESNALFMPRTLWDELGGYDARFTSRGGGLANPDVFIRACELPGTQLIRIEGEATFHQIHGGTTSNAPDDGLHVLKAISREYFQIRGKPLAAVRKAGWRFDSRSKRLIEPMPIHDADAAEPV